MCNALPMLTNVSLDHVLLETARRIGKHRTKKQAAVAALTEYVQRRRQLEILQLFGTVDFDPSYDYKTERRKKRMPSLT